MQQSPMPPQKKKRGPLFWILLILGILLAIGLCKGAIQSASSTSTTTTIQATATPDIAATNIASSEATQNAATPYSSTPVNTGYTPPPSNGNSGSNKVGDTITLNDVDATLTKVKVGPVNSYDIPKSGYEFVAVHVKLHNHSGSEYNYSQLDFHTKSGTGNITDLDSSTYGDGINDLGSGTLSDGGTAEGNIVFQVKIGDHKAMITWQPNSFTDSAGDNGWLLGL